MGNRYWFKKIEILCLIFSVAFNGAAYANFAKLTSEPTKESLLWAIHSSAAYLSDQVSDNGMFQYRVNMDPGVRVSPKYNILRHCGAIYAMTMYYKQYPDKRIRASILRAGRYLQKEAIGPVNGHPDMKAVWSKPEVNHSRNSLQAKLGGTGLGLVALLSIESVEIGFTPISELRKLGRFILFMQKDDGSFYSKFIPINGGRQDNWESLYYPGETSLGLTMLYEKDPDRIWLQAAAKALSYLARTRKTTKEAPADHWALVATTRLLGAANERKTNYSKDMLIQHAVQVADAILQRQCLAPLEPVFYGGFAEDGRVTPTATSLEGLIAARSILPEAWQKTAIIDLAINHGIDFLLRAQIKEGPFTGAFPRAVAKQFEGRPEAEKFNRRAGEIRIDYVQHALSAFLGYLGLNE